MMEHVNWIHNIPFFSIFLAMFCGIITPLIKNGKTAYKVHALMVLIVAIMSAILLVNMLIDRRRDILLRRNLALYIGLSEIRSVSPVRSISLFLFSVRLSLYR